MAFLLLNVFDLFLTGWIFRHKGMEANGLAAFIQTHFGDRGDLAFAIYKFLMVLFIIIVCEVIATRSVLKARIIMLLGCTVYCVVVLYECYLIKFVMPNVQAEDAPAILSYAVAMFQRLF
jgi:hypothetical protein